MCFLLTIDRLYYYNKVRTPENDLWSKRWNIVYKFNSIVEVLWGNSNRILEPSPRSLKSVTLFTRMCVILGFWFLNGNGVAQWSEFDMHSIRSKWSQTQGCSTTLAGINVRCSPVVTERHQHETIFLLPWDLPSHIIKCLIDFFSEMNNEYHQV